MPEMGPCGGVGGPAPVVQPPAGKRCLGSLRVWVFYLGLLLGTIVLLSLLGGGSSRSSASNSAATNQESAAEVSPAAD